MSQENVVNIEENRVDLNNEQKSLAESYDFKLSIVVPCYNVEKYIEQCLDSIVKQTLKDIEIICVNDGSTDNTLNIIKNYAAEDPRFFIINKKNSGYGDSMNQGFAHARGHYVGIVESDDFIEPEMFETLYNTAALYDADVVKSNFWFYWSDPKKNELYEYFREEECGKVITPRKYDNGSLYGRKPSIWSAIYKNSFIKENNIDFLPTPGASYQDTSFTFKVYSSAQKMVCLYDAFLHYRQDNENSSINNADKKMNCVLDEYNEIKRYVDSYPKSKKRKRLYSIYGAAYYDACIWMYELLSPRKRYIFLKKISPIFTQLINDIGVEKLNFGNMWWKRRDIVRISKNPYEYHMWRNDERYDQKAGTWTYPESTTPINNLYLEDIPAGKNDSPDFSVIIPVYNVEKYLPSALESLLYQTYENIEIICVNDGSTDHSLSVIESYAEIDERIIIINQKNSGPSIARNTGLSIARGKYVVFLDADDYLAENAFEVLKETVEGKKEPDAVEFGADPFPAAPRASEWHYSVLTTPDEYYEKIDEKTFLTTLYLRIYCWRYCFKLSFLRENDLKFDTDFKYGEDALFLMNALLRMNGLYVISDKLYNYRHFRPDSLMNRIFAKNVQYAAQQLAILEEMLNTGLNVLGFTPSAKLLEYSCDFIYGSINNCPMPDKRNYIVQFLSLLEKYSLNAYIEDSSENCQGFYNFCIDERKAYNYEHSFRGRTKRLLIKIKVETKHLIARFIPPSRRIFYEHSARIIDYINVQQHSINMLQQQVREMQAKLDLMNNKKN